MASGIPTYKFIPTLTALSEPVCCHAVPGPWGLADPAPLETASGPCANHVHTAPISFGRRSTLGTRFGCHFDGNFGSLIPPSFGRTQRIDCVVWCSACIRLRCFQTFSYVITLQAIAAEYEPASVLTLYPLALRINEKAHSTSRLRTQDTSVSQDKLLRGKTLIAFVLFLGQ